MGTAGWLIIFFNMFKENYGNNIDVYGNDVKENTYQLGLMNLIITMGKLPNTENINCSSSLTHVNDTKLHFIATNPPFKTDMPFGNIKDLFESYQEKTGGNIKVEDVYKLQSNSPPIQFIELCIYKLVENGLCVIVLPFGELFTGGGDNERFRRHMLEHTNITDIIGFPSGIYKHTGITTAIVIFRNDKSGTKSIKFSRVEANSNKECEKIIELFDISKEDLLKHSGVSFNSNDYIKEDECAYSDAIEIKTLGEVCEFLVKSDRKASYGKTKGNYPFYTSSQELKKYVDEPDYNEESLIIGTGGNANIKYDINIFIIIIYFIKCRDLGDKF
jgi:type I restriction-modification system DNA methylase subunit